MTERKKITIQISAALLNRLKNTVYWTPGITMSSSIELAIEDLLEDMEKENGGVFEQRLTDLKPGRPIK